MTIHSLSCSTWEINPSRIEHNYRLKDLQELFCKHVARAPLSVPEFLSRVTRAESQEEMIDAIRLAPHQDKDLPPLHFTSNHGNTLIHHLLVSPIPHQLYKFLSIPLSHLLPYEFSPPLLVDYLDVDIKNNLGMTPLHIAAHRGDFDSFDDLCQNCDPAIPNLAGNTALHLLLINNHAEFCQDERLFQWARSLLCSVSEDLLKLPNKSRATILSLWTSIITSRCSGDKPL